MLIDSPDVLLTLDHFAPCVGETFGVRLDTGEIHPIQLFLAQPLKHSGVPGCRCDPFELRFRGAAPIRLNQRIHFLSHDRLGRMEIFMVPIGEEAGHFIYQAVFN